MPSFLLCLQASDTSLSSWASVDFLPMRKYVWLSIHFSPFFDHCIPPSLVHRKSPYMSGRVGGCREWGGRSFIAFLGIKMDSQLLKAAGFSPAEPFLASQGSSIIVRGLKEKIPVT